MKWNLYAPGSYSSRLGDAKATLRRMVELTDGTLVTLTGGELRKEEANWLVSVTRQIFNTLVGMPIGLSGGRYWHYLVRKLLGCLLFPVIAIRVTHGKMPKLPHDKWAKEDGEVIEDVKYETGCGALPMRGMPTARAFKFFSGVPGFSSLFEQRTVQAIRSILENNPNTVIQFELPAELAFTSAPLPRKWREKIARRMAASIERIIRQLPTGSQFAFHLCWGDLRRRPFVFKGLQRSINKVLLVNALASLSVWREGWKLYAIQDPFCDGINLPAEDPAVYEAYEELVQFPSGVTYALGLLHHRFSAARTAAVAKVIEPILVRAGVSNIALSPPCGDGRKLEDEVVEQWAIGREALELLDAA